MKVDAPRIAAIYRIRNRQTGEVYVGATVNLYQRIKAHVSTLNRGSHENLKLRHAWATTGQGNFAFSILEIVYAVEMLEPREQYWLDRAIAAGSGVYNARHQCRWAVQPSQRGLIDWSTYRPMSRAKRLESERRRRPPERPTTGGEETAQ